MHGFVRASQNHQDSKEDRRPPEKAAADALYAQIVDSPSHQPDIQPLYAARFYCQVCRRHIANETPTQHETSIEHLLHRGIESNGPRLVIPQGNVGAKILAKLGWRDDGKCPGLGKMGREGRLAPLPVALKRDTAGLGARRYLSRVTHSQTEVEAQPPKAASAIPPCPVKERNIRRQLNSDDLPLGFEKLLEDHDDAGRKCHRRTKRRRTSQYH